MKDNLEWERTDLRVDSDMEVDCDIGQQITAYIETWFDGAKKFAGYTDMTGVDWINMYAKYDPFADTLRMECVAVKQDTDVCFDYTPTDNEAQLIKAMIAEELQRSHGQSPRAFCAAFYGGEMTMEGMT